MILLDRICRLKIIHVDSVSRLLVPKDLIAFASLDKEIVLSSSVNVVEVWDKMLYEESVANSLENFGNLTEEVMGGLGNQNSNDIP